MATLCLYCRRKRIETVCGDQSCPCRGGPRGGFMALEPISRIDGMTYRRDDGSEVMTKRCECGRWYSKRVK